MTVKQLRAWLEEYGPDVEVLVRDTHGFLNPAMEVSLTFGRLNRLSDWVFTDHPSNREVVIIDAE